MSSDNNLVGQVLAGRYRIFERLGQGHSSTVYRAFDSQLKEPVVVKVILDSLTRSAGFQGRFEEIAAAVAKLRHPNIVRVLDYGQDRGQYYIVESPVLGETLRERLRRLNEAGQHLGVAEAVKYALQIVDAVGYAHQQGMLHRDIRPANILLDKLGQAILMDFGMVQLAGGHQHTATAALVDTAHYMPPEVIRGESPVPRSDLYSLGVTLYEMLSGHPPFEGASLPALLRMHLNEPVPDVRDVRSDVPAVLWSVLWKALAKDLTGRYASMAGLGLALHGIVEPQQRTAASDLQATLHEEPEMATEPARFAIPPQPVSSTAAAQPVAAATRLEAGSQLVAAATRLEDTAPQPSAAAPAPTHVDLEPLPNKADRTVSLSAPKRSVSRILGNRGVRAVAALLVLSLSIGLAAVFAQGSGQATRRRRRR